jgi:hypothetical protein
MSPMHVEKVFQQRPLTRHDHGCRKFDLSGPVAAAIVHRRMIVKNAGYVVVILGMGSSFWFFGGQLLSMNPVSPLKL